MRKAVSTCNMKGKYLFSWNDVLGEDNKRLKNFLGRSFSSDWIKEAKIEISEDAKTIRVFTEEKSLFLVLDDENGEVSIKLDDGRTGKLIASKEKDKWIIYKEYTIEVSNIKENRICQGDIMADVKYIESFKEVGEYYDVSLINFPLIVILSQDCDLNEDYQFRHGIPEKHNDHDKIMFSLLVAPLYTASQVLYGDHLSDLNPPNTPPELSNLVYMKMQEHTKDNKPKEPKSIYNNMKNNEFPRYHFLRFPESVQISDSFIDFKHYFSINITYLEELKQNNFVCRIDMPYRELISQRFSNYLSRIGLPEFHRSEIGDSFSSSGT